MDVAIAKYEALGMAGGVNYYIATREATLGHADNDVVTAASYCIHPDFSGRPAECSAGDPQR